MRQSLQTAYDPPPGTAIATLAYEYPARWNVPEHAHGSDQFVYAASGAMEVVAGRQRWLIPPQFAVWIPAETPHSIRMANAVSMRTLYLRRGLARAMPRSCAVLHVAPLLRTLILEAVRLGGLHIRVPLHRAMKDLIVAGIEAASPVPTFLVMPGDRRALAVADQILADPSRSQSLTTLCLSSGASPRTIERLFRRELGMDFEMWRRQARLMRAVELLIAGNSVQETAARVGYRQPSAFVAMFRRMLGATPKAWISALRKAE